MIKRILFSFALLILALSSLSAQKYTLSGYVKDSSNSEAIIGATIYVKEIQNGVAANDYGFFSISLPAGTYNVVIASLGYKELEKTIELTENKTINFILPEDIIVTQEVIVKGERADVNV